MILFGPNLNVAFKLVMFIDALTLPNWYMENSQIKYMKFVHVYTYLHMCCLPLYISNIILPTWVSLISYILSIEAQVETKGKIKMYLVAYFNKSKSSIDTNYTMFNLKTLKLEHILEKSINWTLSAYNFACNNIIFKCHFLDLTWT